MTHSGKCHAIIVAAGAGTRMGLDGPKQFADLQDRPIWIRTLDVFIGCAAVHGITVVIPSGYKARCREMLDKHNITHPISLIRGGADRGESVCNALRTLPQNTDIVLIHDSVRPFVTAAQIEAVAEQTRLHAAAVLAVPVKDTVKTLNKTGDIAQTPDRSRLVLAQTPQGFNKNLLQRAYDAAETDGFLGTDDASYVERLGICPVVVEGDYRNIKLTTPEDMLLAEAFL